MTDSSLKAAYTRKLIEGRYRLIRLLSEGNFGAVFHGKLEIFAEPIRDVAVKITKETQLSKQKAFEIFGEAMTLIQVYDRITDPLARQHIVPIYDLGVTQDDDQRGFVVMGLIVGLGSSSDRIKPPDTLAAEIARYQSGMPTDVAVEFFRQICTGLAGIHDLNVIHRDLKPDNVLLTDRGQIRIVDFGLAVELNESGFALGVAGTHHYMAPETALHGQSDTSSDVYSLGIVFYEMLTGVYPFADLVPPPSLIGEDRNQWVLRQKHAQPPKAPSTLQRNVPSWISDLVLDCLRFRSSDGRPASARSLLDRLQRGSEGRQVENAEQLKHSDGLFAEDWQAWFSIQRPWADSASQLEQLNIQHTSPHESLWFEIKARLVICYIQLERVSDASELVKELEHRIDQGLFLPSYRERKQFYEGLAEIVQGKRGLSHWSRTFDNKAKEAARKGRLT